MSVDQFFNRSYNRQSYNCAHFVVEVIKALQGVDITETMQGFLMPPRDRTVRAKLRRSFVKLEKPENYCIVLMQRARTTPHVGVFIDGKVLQIHEKGVEYFDIDLASRGFTRVRLYKCLNR